MQPLPPFLSEFVNALVGDYRVDRVIGKGGMAWVLLAEERALKRLVALKLLDPALAPEPLLRSRFAREAEAAASLQHPHIVPIYRVGEAAGLPYYAMQYVEGETLAERLEREGKLPPESATRIVREVAQALRAAHRRGIVHRDVKPQNILISSDDGRALVTDFGIARLIDDATATRARESLTGVGFSIGTPRYMSPEQVEGSANVGPASDLYSLGVVLYEALTGQFPYADIPGRSVMLSHAVDPIVPLAKRDTSLPAQLVSVTERLLEKSPDQRFTSADALLEALATTGERTAAQATAAMPRLRTRRIAIGAALLAVVAAGTVLVLTKPATAAEDPRRSLLVGYFDNTTRDPALDWLRIGGVELLTRSLVRWNDLRVVETPRLLDLARRAGLDEDAGMSQADVIKLARESGAGTAAVGSILRTGTDRSSITLRLYDVSTGDLIRQEVEEAASDTLMPDAFARLADRVFSIAGAPAGAVTDDEPPTRSIVAYREFISGLRATNRWRLDSAELHLRAAVEADPSFGLAWIRRAENNYLVEGPTEGVAAFQHYADSALAHSRGRPLKERLLIEALHHHFSADFPAARASARRLISLDSNSVDGWRVLGLALLFDRYIHADAEGKDSVGFDPTMALRAFRRATALDVSNRQVLAFQGFLLGMAAYEMDGRPTGQLPMMRHAPSWTTAAFLAPVRQFRYVFLTDDSARFGPAEVITRQTSPAEFERSRLSALGSLQRLLAEWLAVAPDDMGAQFTRVRVAELTGDWETALAAFERVAEVGSPTEPWSPDWERLRLHMLARNDSMMLVISDRLAERLDRELPMLRSAPWVIAVLANAQARAGRVDEAFRTIGVMQQIIRSISPRQRLSLTELEDTIADLRRRAWTGQVGRAELPAAEAQVKRLIDAVPDSLHTTAALRVFPTLGLPAAMLGDTARVATYRAALAPSRRSTYPGLDAMAAAVAGDKQQTVRALQRVASDTGVQWPGSNYLASRAALLSGRAAEALRYAERVDSGLFRSTGTLDLDWLFSARAIKARGDAALALGDSARARREYERFVTLWRNADAELAGERVEAQRKLDSLRTAGDRAGVRVPTQPSR